MAKAKNRTDISIISKCAVKGQFCCSSAGRKLHVRKKKCVANIDLHSSYLLQ